ncbi:MAG: serine kinase [Actinomycetota bacterium]
MSTPDERLDGIELLSRSIERAIENGASVETDSFAIAGATVEFRFVGADARPPLTQALGHLRGTGAAGDGLRVDVLDGAAADADLTPLLRFVMRAAGVPNLGTRHEIPELTTDRGRAIAIPWDGVLAMYDREQARAWVWIADHTALPLWDFGAPFRSVLNWWLSDNAKHCVHAAAVGDEHGAVLLTGKGGSGKSTSALACLGSQLGYLSDDYCIVEAGDQPQVHSLYSTGKLRGETDLARFPHMRPWISNHERIGEEKQLMFLHDHVPEALMTSAPLRAILLPTVVPEGPTRVEPISGGAALKALAPTSMFQLPDSGPAAFATMAALAKRVPSFVMHSGPEVSTIPNVIEALLADLAQGAPVA